jgi:hypothetical protein
MKTWYVYAVSESSPAIVKAPSEGVAIETYLAHRGMMSYDQKGMICQEVRDSFSCTDLKDDWDIPRLQTFHKWRGLIIGV